MYRQVHSYIDRQIVRQIVSYIDRQLDRQIDSQIEGQIDSEIDRYKQWRSEDTWNYGISFPLNRKFESFITGHDLFFPHVLGLAQKLLVTHNFQQKLESQKNSPPRFRVGL